MKLLEEHIRDTIVKVILAVTLICLALDVSFFVFYFVREELPVDIVGYVFRRIVMPFLTNLIVWLIARGVNDMPKCPPALKKYICALSLCSLTGVIAIFHNYYMPLWVIPMIAVLFCSIFHDRVLHVVLTLYGALLVTAAVLVTIYEHPYDIRIYIENGIVVYCVMVICCVVGFSMLKYTFNMARFMNENFEEREVYRHRLETDGLTGLFSRPYLQERAESALRHASAANPVSFAIIDLDHFKRINDTFGHDNGDVVLRTLGETVQRYLGDNLFAGRYGGEEFVLIFSGGTAKEHYDQIERIRREFGSQRYAFTMDPVTFSGGMVTVTTTKQFLDVFKAADNALYKSKETGRNQVTIA